MQNQTFTTCPRCKSKPTSTNISDCICSKLSCQFYYYSSPGRGGYSFRYQDSWCDVYTDRTIIYALEVQLEVPVALPVDVDIDNDLEKILLLA
jgi:hypothetical protein